MVGKSFRVRVAACGAAVVLGAAAGCSTLMSGSPAASGAATFPAQSPSPTALPTPDGEPDAEAGELDACALLPLDLAEETIERRVRLQTQSAPGGSECLYGNVDRNQPPYAVDLDVQVAGPETLQNLRTGYAQPTVRIADESGLGAGAFSALNVTSATVVCVGDGVAHEVEVMAPPFPPEDIAANAAFALERVRGLAARYCP